MKKSLVYISLAAATIGGFASCKKQLEIEPRQSVDISVALASREGINASITGIYSRLKSTANYGRNFLALAEALSDNSFATNKSGRLVNENNNVPNAHFNHWQNNYYAIAQINQTLAAIPTLNIQPAVTPSERDRWIGELSFLRALYYHDLARAYAYEPGMGVQGQDRGGVPVVTVTPTTVEGAVSNLPARASVDSVYRRIYADLNEANRLLPAANTGFPHVATKVAAQALFARVALYNRDWTNAARWADSVLNQASIANRLTNVAGYVPGWTGQTHPESIFEVRFANQIENIGVNESLQTSYSTLLERGNRGVVGGFGDLVPNTALLQALGFSGIAANGANGTFTARSADVRNLLVEPGSTARGTARLEVTKFIGKNGVANLDNVPVIRVPEVILIRAEARLNLGNLAGARQDVVTLKQNRYANYSTLTEAQNDQNATGDLPAMGVAPANGTLYAEILRQRRLEFHFEGHRWFDFKRLGLSFGKTNLPTYSDFKMLAPIPVREVDLNPRIQQNFGY